MKNEVDLIQTQQENSGVKDKLPTCMSSNTSCGMENSAGLVWGLRFSLNPPLSGKVRPLKSIVLALSAENPVKVFVSKIMALSTYF